jgi:triphosphoribosyl-dephospho-CoA synthetase
MSFWKKLGGAVMSAIPIAGQLYTANQNKKAQERADRQNIKFFNMQNAYNDPSLQMARLKKAGLNPNLIYGQSVAGATGNSGSAPSPSRAAPTGAETIIPNTLASFQAQANIENTNADTLDKMQKIGVDKKYLEPMARAELQKMSLGNIQQYLKNKQLTPFVQTAVERAAEDLLTVQAKTSTAQAKQKIAEFQSRLSQMNINPSGTLGMTLLRMVMASIPQLSQFLVNPETTLD